MSDDVKRTKSNSRPSGDGSRSARSAPTLEEVAGLAAVSTATVSRVVNRSPNVRPDTRRAVEDAIATLGYVPDRAARTLVTRRTDTIALVVPDGLVEHGDFGHESGAHAMRALLERRADVDGVFVGNDPMAIEALEALQALGRRVPDDVAVVGFDDIAAAASTTPPLTTVRQPLEQMTKAMAELLLRRMSGSASADEFVVCPTELVRRSSA